MNPKPHSPHLSILSAIGLALSMALSGCIEAGDDTHENGDPSPPDGTPSVNVTIPAPIILEGSALAINPLSDFTCLNEGIDGGHHELGTDVAGWNYHLEPDGFVAWWWTGDEWEGGEAHGRVPSGSTDVEVCYIDGIGPADYTLTITHPDHETG